MNEAKRRATEALGYRFGDAADFLGLTDEERRLVELRLAVGIATRNLRQAAEMTQATLAERVGSSPSRVNKVEHGLPGVSIDLAFKALFAAVGSIADLVGKEASEPPRWILPVILIFWLARR